MSGAGGNDDDDPPGLRAWHWIENVGKPMIDDVRGLKQAAWTVAGGGAVVGSVLTVIIGVVLKKVGWS